MVPLLILVVVFSILRLIGWAGASLLDDWHVCLRAALAAMFLVTASAHWGKRRQDLVRMVPPMFPRRELLVTSTGVLEIFGAVGLLLPSTARIAAIGLAVLLVAMFPANIHAARNQLTIGGRPATALRYRLPLQVLFIACLIAVAVHQ